MFTNQSLNYLIGIICFFSGLSLDVKSILNILKVQESLLLFKVILVSLISYLYIQLFGVSGVFGVSALSLVAVQNASHPSMFLALTDDFSMNEEQGAFGLVSIQCLPTVPLFLFSLSQTTAVDWSPIVSTLIPVILGIILGNLDQSIKEFFAPVTGYIMPLLGWQLGFGINLPDTFRSIPQGMLLVIVYYLIITLPMLFFERGILKNNGLNTISFNTVSGISISVPLMIASSNPELAHLVPPAAAAVTLAVIVTTILSPIFAQKLHQKVATE